MPETESIPQKSIMKLSHLIHGFQLGRSALYFLESQPLPIIRKIFDPSSRNTTGRLGKMDQYSFQLVNQLLKQDALNITEGLYPLTVLELERPAPHFKRLLKIFADAAFMARRRNNKASKAFSRKAKQWLEDLPEYYQRNFHYQTDGYLSEKSAEIYEHQVELLFAGTANAMRRSVLRPLKDQFKAHPTGRGLRFLEVACGRGTFTKYLAQAFPEAEIVAMDLSHPYLQVAKDHLRSFPRVSIQQGKAEDLPFKDATFDAVVSVFLFHELPLEVRKQVLAESHRVLKETGLAAMVDSIQMHDDSNFEWALQEFPKSFHEPFYKNYVNHPMEELFSTSGFSQIETGRAFLSKYLTAQK